MADEKVYTPEVVVENPFPGGDIPVPVSQSQTPAGTYTPTATKPKSFPTRKIATELIGSALNTRSKKILQEFEFAQHGAIQVGKYENGVSGDVKITPNGLVGRNISGLTTFGLDTDGNLILVGELRSGSTVTGSVSIEDGGYILIGTSIFIGDTSNV